MIGFWLLLVSIPLYILGSFLSGSPIKCMVEAVKTNAQIGGAYE